MTLEGEARLVSGCRGPARLDVESVTEHRIGDRRAARCRARQEHSARDQRDAKATDQQKTNMQLASQVPSLTSPRRRSIHRQSRRIHKN